MAERPTPERPAVEPEIIPPGRRETRRDAGAWHVRISFIRPGDGRPLGASPGALGIILALLFGILAIATFVVLFATLFVWIVAAGVSIAIILLIARLLGRLRPPR